MSYSYGYGELEDRLITLFQSGPPDFKAAEELIRQGADLNAVGESEDENILYNILGGYWTAALGDTGEGYYRDVCGPTSCLGQWMCEIIRFFLDHGFDVNKCDGCFGAQCLDALALSTFDRSIIEATKLLLDAGAKNRTTSPTSTDKFDTPLDSIELEGSYQATCEHDHATANIFKAVCQIYQAVADGRPYNGIDSYEQALGKTVLKVLAETNGTDPVFYFIDLPEYKQEHCFNSTLYFVYEGGVLITTQYAQFWTDTVMPQVPLTDVSDSFGGMVGSSIKSITFDHRQIEKGINHYGQPITIIEMDSGHKVRFSINFGEVKEENRAAFYRLI